MRTARLKIGACGVLGGRGNPGCHFASARTPAYNLDYRNSVCGGGLELQPGGAAEIVADGTA